MKDRTRRMLDAVNKVYALSKAHMSEIQGYVEAVQEMGEKLARADALAAQQEAGELQANAAKAMKDAHREAIVADHVVHLVRIARVALPRDPEIRRLFRRPTRTVNRQEFVAAVRAMLEEAVKYREIFVREGMAETFAEDLEAQLTRYLAAVEKKGLSEAQRVGAVAGLPEVTKELMALVRRLDAINRKRWQDNPELLAAWRSAKDVTWPHPKPVEPEPGSGGEHAA